MGKKLIIKGADFSTNGIQTLINITELITTFVDGTNGIHGGSETNKKAIYPRFSIEEYRQAGYSKISINVKSLGCYPFITSVGPTGTSTGHIKNFDDSQTYLPTKGVYTLDLDDVDPNQAFIYFGLNLNKSQADISSDNLSDYIEITMEM